LTTHRSLAEEAVDEAQELLGRKTPSKTANSALPGGAGLAIEPFTRAFVEHAGGLAPNAPRLVNLYGANADKILDLARSTGGLDAVFDVESGALAAEVVYAVEHEGAETLEDILMRRTMVGLGGNLGVGADLAAAQIAVEHLGWSQSRATDEVAAYRKHIERFKI
jgi:glycerol-3-phosphate dehydrogenase